MNELNEECEVVPSEIKDLAELNQSEAQNEIDRADKGFVGKTEVNGIEISVAWDQGYGEYTIFFPGIKESEKQVVRINRNIGDAQEVFEFAKSEAEAVEDPIDLYKKVFEFSKKLE